MIQQIRRTLSSGKNPKWIYYLRSYWRYVWPKALWRLLLGDWRTRLKARPDYDYIMSRVDYYNAMPIGSLAEDSPRLSMHRPGKQKVYFFDTYEFTRYFPQHLRWAFHPGDVTYVPDEPAIVKSRPLGVDNRRSVLMKLDKVRHFTYVADRKPWRDKMDRVVFRGKVAGKESRIRFMEMYFDHPMCDLGDVSRHSPNPRWVVGKKTIPEHLDYKFVMALEGNDVASNLKWVMSSQCLAVMPRPTCETWFMEGTLVPGYHYVEIRPDFSDLEERIRYYLDHPEEAEAIIRHANEYVAQFRDEPRERLISLAVLDRYFERSQQTQP